jgi:hypothetical protein
LDILLSAFGGVDAVLTGGAVTPNTLLLLNGAKAAVMSAGVLKAVAASTTITIGAADATNPRIDLVVINSSGAWAVRAGTAAAAPKPPSRTANDVVMAAVYVPATDTTIGAGQITDMRVIRTGSMCIHKVTTAVVFNTTNSIQSYISLVIPSGLFLAGRVLRVRAGGTFLMNSGTNTLTLTIAYGGTTMFADSLPAGYAVDADRRAWYIDFDIIAQANNDQAMYGSLELADVGTFAQATSGIGEIGVATNYSNPIGGSAAVDSDAADRTLTLQWTMSISNAAAEITMEGATVDLL